MKKYLSDHYYISLKTFSEVSFILFCCLKSSPISLSFQTLQNNSVRCSNCSSTKYNLKDPGIESYKNAKETSAIILKHNKFFMKNQAGKVSFNNKVVLPLIITETFLGVTRQYKKASSLKKL